MKILISILLFVSSFAQAQDVNLPTIYGSAVYNVDVIEGRLSKSVTLNYEKPCGASPIGLFSASDSENNSILGVFLDYDPSRMACEAMPTPMKVTTRVPRSSTLQVLGLTTAAPETEMEPRTEKLADLYAATVVRVERISSMFPTSTLRLTYMEPCGERAVGVLSQSLVGTNSIAVAVVLERNNQAACLAEPSEQTVLVRVLTMSANQTIKVLGLQE
jgi:hypothetical protein